MFEFLYACTLMLISHYCSRATFSDFAIPSNQCHPYGILVLCIFSQWVYRPTKLARIKRFCTHPFAVHIAYSPHIGLNCTKWIINTLENVSLKILQLSLHFLDIPPCICIEFLKPLFPARKLTILPGFRVYLISTTGLLLLGILLVIGFYQQADDSSRT